MQEPRMEVPEIKEMSVTMKRVTSYAIWFCSFSFGMVYNFLSPSLIELQNKYNVDTDEISKVFVIILLAYLVGALLCGVLFNFVNRQLLIVFILYMMAIGALVIPYLPTITLFFVAGGFIGLASGGFDTGQVVWTLEMWQGECGIYVQSQYFFFALGTFIAPILLKPFLLEEHKDDFSTTTPEDFGFSSTTRPNVTEEKSQLYIPLSIGGAVIILASSCVLFLYFYDKYIPPPQKEKDQNGNSERELVSGEEVAGDGAKSGKWNKVILIALSAAVLGCYQGMEICTFQFIPTFSHYIDLRLPEQQGALVLSGLTGAFTAGRFLGIFLIMYVKLNPVWILAVNLVISTAGNIVLLMGANHNLTALWCGAVLLGLGYSTVFACLYDYIEKHLTITNMVAATMVIAGGLVSAMYPLLVGEFVDKKPFVLNYTIFFSLVVCTCAFLYLYFLTSIRKRI